MISLCHVEFVRFLCQTYCQTYSHPVSVLDVENNVRFLSNLPSSPVSVLDKENNVRFLSNLPHRLSPSWI